MKYIEFLPFLPFHNTFEYQSHLNIESGDILRCRFGRFDTLGVAIAVNNEKQTQYNLTSVSEIIFKNVLGNKQIELIQALEKYYGYHSGLFAKLFFPFSIKNAKFPNNIEMIRLHKEATLKSSRAKKWQIIYNTLKHGNAVESSAFIGLTPFKKKDLIETFLTKIETKNFQEDSIFNAKLPKPSSEQNKVIEDISCTSGFTTHLIHGKTGSGKTEVYAHLVQKLLSKMNIESNSTNTFHATSHCESLNPQILILLPEIGLVKVIAERLSERFKCVMPIWHSSTPEAKRKEYFKLINDGSCNVIIGTRSALFLPFKNLRMIIIDEEHDGSYKQEETPVYNARDAAVLFGKMLNIPVILGSATPSVESYFNAQSGKYRLHTLNARFANVQMPEIQIINEKSKYLVFPTLQKKIIENYILGKQTLIFINRRGFAPINKCKSCKGIFKCEACDSLLTYHKKKSILICHKCNYTIPLHSSCTMCGEDISIHSSGAGVEAVYEEVIKLIGDYHHNLNESSQYFNANSIAIFSSDEQSTENKLSNFIQDVQNSTIKIIIGTQIASKGYDFPNLRLVCILDLILKNDEIDFKSDEKLMQILTQVSGRSGRSEERGLVLIQSKRKKEEIERIIVNDQSLFYKQEIQTRKDNFLPPFSRFISITILDKNEKLASHNANKIIIEIRQQIKCNVFGPAPAPIAFIKNVYRYKILLITHRSQMNIAHKLSKILQKYRAKIDVDAINFY